MSYMGGNSRARVNPNAPEAWAICDRCGNLHNLVDLTWQYQWRGQSLQSLNILVCAPCLDKPQEQLRTIIIPPDPQPVMNARPAQWASEMGPAPPNIPVVQLIDGDD